jgi:hypothetical protein
VPTVSDSVPRKFCKNVLTLVITLEMHFHFLDLLPFRTVFNGNVIRDDEEMIAITTAIVSLMWMKIGSNDIAVQCQESLKKVFSLVGDSPLVIFYPRARRTLRVYFLLCCSSSSSSSSC